MSCLFTISKNALLGMRSGLEPASQDDAAAEAWVKEFAEILVRDSPVFPEPVLMGTQDAVYDAGLQSNVHVEDDEDVSAMLEEVRQALQHRA